MVFGNTGEGSGTGVCFTRDPSTGEAHLYGEFLVNAQGEDVVAGIRTPEPIAGMRERLPGGLRAARRDDRPARAALPRHAGHRVHGRGRHALPAPDAHRKAHRPGRPAGRGGDGRRRAHHPGGGGRAHRPRPARPAAASDDRPRCGDRGRRNRAQRVAGRRIGRDRARRGHGGGARSRGRGGDPRALGDDSGRHPRPHPGARGAHRARGHDVPRCGGRARDGEAMRGGLRGARARRRHGCRAHRRVRAACR